MMPDLTDEEMAAVIPLRVTLGTLADMFQSGQGDLPLMRTAIQVVRESADALEAYANRWESSVQDQ